MKISTKDLIIFYEQDEKEIEQLVNVLSQNLERILHFFRLESLSKPVEIILYSTTAAYMEHVVNCGLTYQEWMIADTFDGKINIATIEVCKKSISHQAMTSEEYSKLIIHELVHICQQEVNPNCYGCEWFWEALATNLAEQKMSYPQTLCTKDELMFRYAEIPNAYSISYHLGQYMLKNLPEEKIYDYIVNPNELWKDTENLLAVLG